MDSDDIHAIRNLMTSLYKEFVALRMRLDELNGAINHRLDGVNHRLDQHSKHNDKIAHQVDELAKRFIE